MTELSPVFLHVPLCNEGVIGSTPSLPEWVEVILRENVVMLIGFCRF
jgi:hypothetical protein